jgi:hypothetical protein
VLKHSEYTRIILESFMTHSLSSNILRFITVVIAAALLWGCARVIPPVGCEDPNFDCFSDQAILGIKEVREQISYWSNVNFLAQIFIAISGMVATVMIALQGDENRHWTRPIGLVSTALVTGLTSALVSFHVPENVDKLVEIVDRMATVHNNFDYEVVKLRGGRSKKEVEAAFKTDEAFRTQTNDLTRKFVTDYNKIKLEMLRLSGTAARLQTTPTPTSGAKKTE